MQGAESSQKHRIVARRIIKSDAYGETNVQDASQRSASAQAEVFFQSSGRASSGLSVTTCFEIYKV